MRLQRPAGLALVAVLALAGCGGGSEAIPINSAAVREYDDRVIDIVTTGACGRVRVEVEEDADTVTLRAYDNRSGDDCAWAEGVADLEMPLAGRTVIDGARGVALDVDVP